MPILPAAWQPYAKSIVAFLGAVVTWAVTAFPDLPSWVGTIPGLLTVVAVYLVPNAPVIPGDDHDSEPQ